MNDNLARRNLLGAAFSTLAVSALSAATAAPVLPFPADPIFRALAAWEAADLDVMRVYAETKGDDSPEADARCDVECRRRDAVGMTLGATTPTTLPGVLALARHYTATASNPDSDGLTHLVAALSALARASPG